VIDAIHQSLGKSFENVLFALGIRHVGKTTANDLAQAFGSMEGLERATEEELAKVPGIGSVIAGSIRDFMDNPENRRLLDRLRAAGLKMEGAKRAEGPLSGKVFLFTGELESMSRGEAEAAVVLLGGKAGSTVTKATDFVVVGRDPGSKLEKAKAMKKTILDEKAFLEMVKRR
jgi:DNA ligase (NAD+)